LDCDQWSFCLNSPLGGHSCPCETEHRLCDPCLLHPGDTQRELSASSHNSSAAARPCSRTAISCLSPVCFQHSAKTRVFVAVSTFPDRQSLNAAGVSQDRVLTIEGNPIMMMHPRAAQFLAAMTTTAGRSALRFIVVYRPPVELAFSFWGHKEASRSVPIEQYMARALSLIEHCDADHNVWGGGTFLSMPTARLAAYTDCLLSAKTSPSRRLHGGMYALLLSTYLRNGFNGSQFLLISMRKLTGDAPGLQRSLAAFLNLTVPQGATGLCTTPLNTKSTKQATNSLAPK